jgi:hypothetical protein
MKLGSLSSSTSDGFLLFSAANETPFNKRFSLEGVYCGCATYNFFRTISATFSARICICFSESSMNSSLISVSVSLTFSSDSSRLGFLGDSTNIDSAVSGTILSLGDSLTFSIFSKSF